MVITDIDDAKFVSVAAEAQRIAFFGSCNQRGALLKRERNNKIRKDADVNEVSDMRDPKGVTQMRDKLRRGSVERLDTGNNESNGPLQQRRTQCHI